MADLSQIPTDQLMQMLGSHPALPDAMKVANPSQNWSNIGAENLKDAGIRPALTDTEKAQGRLMSAIPGNLGDEFMARAASDPMLHQYTKDQMAPDAALTKARDVQSRYTGEHPYESTAIGIPGNVAASSMLPGGPVAQGTASGAIQGFGAGEGGLGNRLASAGKEALVGGATALGFNALGKSLSQPKINPDVQLLKDEGVALTPGQMGGKFAKKTEDIATSVPVMGDFIAKRQNESIEGLNRAVANRSLREINQALPANIAPGRSTVAYVRKAMTDSYNSVLGGMQASPDMPFSAMLQTAKAKAGTLPAAQLDDFNRIINSEIFDKVAKNKGVLDGDAIKGIESTLTDEIKGYGAGTWNEQKLAGALSDAKTAFRDMITRQNPALAPKLAATDRAYANYAILRKAGSATGNDGGVFSPAQLQAAVASADSSAGKGNFASGSARMQDLSDAAKNVLPAKFQDSGTARRLMQGGVLSAAGPAAYFSGSAIPAAGAVGVGTALYTTPGQKLARALMTGQRPNTLATTGNALQLASPKAGALAAMLASRFAN